MLVHSLQAQQSQVLHVYQSQAFPESLKEVLLPLPNENSYNMGGVV